jgi:hypothetical protein
MLLRQVWLTSSEGKTREEVIENVKKHLKEQGYIQVFCELRKKAD